MAAPSATGRPTPVGTMLEDGFSTKVTIASNTDISFWEKSVTPPGIDGEDKIDVSTMHNSAWRTFAVRSLKTLMPMTVTAAYDPDLYGDIISAINTATVITVTFPDASTLAFNGYLRLVEFGDHVEGAQPECTLTIEPLNRDTDGAEQAPVEVSTYGT